MEILFPDRTMAERIYRFEQEFERCSRPMYDFLSRLEMMRGVRITILGVSREVEVKPYTPEQRKGIAAVVELLNWMRRDLARRYSLPASLVEYRLSQSEKAE